MSRYPIILCLCALAMAGCAAPPPVDVDPFLALPGEWGTEGSTDCEVAPQQIRFNERNTRMYLSHAPEAADGTREPRRDADYYVLERNERGLSMSLENQGKPVIWDVVMLGPDQYCWRRGDWPGRSCTDAVNRCKT